MYRNGLLKVCSRHMAGASPIATDMPPVRYEHRMLACIRFNDKQCAQDLVEVDRATRRQVQSAIQLVWNRFSLLEWQ